LLRCSSRRAVGDFLKTLEPSDLAFIASDWATLARDDQWPPPDALGRAPSIWLFIGGRGAGKTRAGAEWVRRFALDRRLRPAREGPVRIALVGPTLAEARQVMVEGPSGLLAVHGRRDPQPLFEPSRRQVTWPGLALAQTFSAEEPDGLRGFQFHAAWCDELAKWRHASATWDMLEFAMRLGDHPQRAITTTPRPIPVIRALLADPSVLVTRARTDDNRRFLAPGFLEHVTARYGGTLLGRQEIEAELIEDDPQALFSRATIEANRVVAAPDLARIVVAVDPPVSRGARAAACGIVSAGLGEDGRGYVLDDHTLEGASPTAWARRAIALYHARAADRLVAEVNQGGDLVATLIRDIDPTVTFRPVHARQGKRLRAEPVAALYEQGRVSHVGAMPELEDEMCSFSGASPAGRSPDRLDALVWALTDLMLERRRPSPRIRPL
jgi:phage terminase large subunit-like protein